MRLLHLWLEAGFVKQAVSLNESFRCQSVAFSGYRRRAFGCLERLIPRVLSRLIHSIADAAEIESSVNRNAGVRCKVWCCVQIH